MNPTPEKMNAGPDVDGTRNADILTNHTRLVDMKNRLSFWGPGVSLTPDEQLALIQFRLQHFSDDVLPQFIKEIADELGCKPDNEAMLQSIDGLRVAAGEREAMARRAGVTVNEMNLVLARPESVVKPVPETVIDQVCHIAAEIHNRGAGVGDEQAQSTIDRIREVLTNVGR